MAKLEQHHRMNRKLLVSLALILCSVISLYSYFGNVTAQTQTTTSCTDVHGPYLLEGNDGGLYGIVGIPFNLQVSNHTSATISGTLVPSTPGEVAIVPAFRGDIFATQWLINGITGSFAQTYTIREATQTTVTTLTNQVVSPTTISRTAHTYSATIELSSTTTTRIFVVGQQTTIVLAPVTVTGYLDYHSEFCLSPRPSSSATSSAAAVSTPASEQLISTTQSNSLLLWALVVAVVVVVAIVLTFVVLLNRRQKRTAPRRPFSAPLALGSSEMVLCSSCGASVKNDANFCEVCGKKLK
jgi:hypothetical protein